MSVEESGNDTGDEAGSESGPDTGRDERKQLYQRGMAFLRQARASSHTWPELAPAQVERIARRLRGRPAAARRARLMPALVALAVVLVAGTALAVAGGELSRLPIIRAFFGRRVTPPTPPAPAPRAATAKASAKAGAASPPRLEAGAAPAQASPTPPTQVSPTPSPSLATSPGAATMVPGLIIPGMAAKRGVAPRRREETLAPIEAPVAAAPDTRATEPPASAATRSAGAPAAPIEPAPQPPAVASVPGAATSPAAPRAIQPAPSPPSATPREPESPIVAESRSFSSALERWHRDRNAPAALAALDTHERRFPGGQLRLEAQVLRAEILLTAGREREALALLDGVSLAGVPRARELRTVRGELRIKAGRCAEAKADLGAVLAEGTADALGRRAQRALASCP